MRKPIQEKNKLYIKVDFKWNNKLNVINKTFPNGTIINKTGFLLSTYHVQDIVVGFVFNIKHKYYVSGLSEYHKVTRKQGVL